MQQTSYCIKEIIYADAAEIKYTYAHERVNYFIIKNTKVQTLGTHTAYLAHYTNVHALKLATPRVVAAKGKKG